MGRSMRWNFRLRGGANELHVAPAASAVPERSEGLPTEHCMLRMPDSPGRLSPHST